MLANSTILIGIFLTFTGFFCLSQPADYVAYFPFNGNANDESGSGNNGTVNGAILTSDKFGIPNGAYSFDGVDDHITSPLNLTTNVPFSISVWVNWGGATGIPREIVSWLFQTSSPRVYLGVSESGQIRFGDNFGATGVQLTPNEWVHIVATYDGNISKIYINSSQSATSGAGVQYHFNGSSLWIGRQGTLDDEYWDGSIDDLRIYDRALTATDVVKIFDVESKVVAFYPFNGNANDESGNGQNGLVNGAGLTNDRFGNANSAYDFDGVDDIISTAVNLSTNQPFTWSVWVNWDGDNGNVQEILSWWHSSQGNSPYFGVSSGTGNIRIGDSFVSSVPLPNSTWKHMVATYDGDITNLFLDGELAASSSSGATYDFTSGQLIIGNQPTFTEFWDGKIDDVRIYNRQLSSSEVNQLYIEEAVALYVSTLGDDANDGSKSFPLRNIQTALTQAVAGDIIKVAGGTYDEGLITQSKVTLLGGYPESFQEDDRNIFSQKTIIRAISTTLVTDNNGCKIDGFVFDGNNTAENGLVISSSSVVTHNVVLRVTQSGGFGIDLSGDALIANNTLHGNVRGIEIFGGSSASAVVKNNIITGHSFGLNNSSADGVHRYNNVFDNAFNYTGNFDSPGVGDISLDPIYSNDATDDFRLSPGSPAIDRGDPADPVGEELPPHGDRIDMGAYGGTNVTAGSVVSSETDILTFSFTEQVGTATINKTQHTVAISVNSGTDLTNLVASFTLSTGASASILGVTQVSGSTANDFTNPVTYTITAEDGTTTQSWTVTVNIVSAGTTDFLSFSFVEQSKASVINSSQSTISAEVVNGTDLSNLVATFTLSFEATASIGGVNQVSGTTVNDFTSPVTYLVTAQDGITTEDWVVTVTVAPDVLTIDLDQANPVTFSKGVNTNAIVRATVTSASSITNVSVRFRRGLETELQIATAVDEGSGVYSHEFQPSDFNVVGINYDFTASNSAGSSAEENGFIDLEIPANSENISTKLSFGNEVTNYRIISIPLEGLTVNQAFDELSSLIYQKDWRIVQYNNGTISDLTGSTSLQPGRGYWFIAKSSATVNIGSGTTVNVDQDNAFIKSINEGWNQIGNPFLASLDWSIVIDHNINKGIISATEVDNELFIYQGGSGSTYTTSTDLAIFEGAFINASSTIGNFEIPLSALSTGRKLRNTGRLESFFFSEDNWRLNIWVKNELLTYGLGALGLHWDASVHKDRYDLYLPPRFLQHVDLSFTMDQIKYPLTQNILPPASGSQWNVVVSNNYRTPTELNWNDEVIRLLEGELIMYIPSSGRIINMKNTGRVVIEPESETHITVRYDIDLPPAWVDKKDQLGDVYPNPFSGEATIPLFIPGKKDFNHVNLNIYNMNGQQIVNLINETLPAGFFQVTWDGISSTGEPVSNGLYLYRLEYDHKVIATKKLLILR